ncbi:hypothetical protein ANCDUO_22379 [Ancylostoma duodenale]|uniref:Uncharacterized protein n=1 Tax=Ancylostoma duodenale TaxID=51022 RepID=A0A0C2FRK9_9BILA|nr:hypothetical protein ANCDUO_22379 [Ancylostoma duodenale]
MESGVPTATRALHLLPVSPSMSEKGDDYRMGALKGGLSYLGICRMNRPRGPRTPPMPPCEEEVPPPPAVPPPIATIPAAPSYPPQVPVVPPAAYAAPPV